MKLDIYQVDAFTNQQFGGNPAAVIPMEEWLPDEMLQNIAMENNLSETAYFLTKEDHYDLRWFTPAAEVDLCGHATLATAHVLWEEMGLKQADIPFHSRSGRLGVKKEGGFYTLDFPTDYIIQIETPALLREALQANILETYRGREDYLVLLESQSAVEQLSPDFKLLKTLNARGVLATAAGREVDFISRCFFPAVGIDEDPVTGSAHTTLAPFWAKNLGKNEFTARQLSRRGGFLNVRLEGERTAISGQATTYMKGVIFI